MAVLGQIGATLLMATANYQAKYILQSPEAGSLLVGLFFLAATFYSALEFGRKALGAVERLADR